MQEHNGLFGCFCVHNLSDKKINKKSLKKAAMAAMPTCIQFSALCKTIIDDDSCAFCWHILLLKCLFRCKYNDFGIIIVKVNIIPPNDLFYADINKLEYHMNNLDVALAHLFYI